MTSSDFSLDFRGQNFEILSQFRCQLKEFSYMSCSIRTYIRACVDLCVHVHAYLSTGAPRQYLSQALRAICQQALRANRRSNRRSAPIVALRAPHGLRPREPAVATRPSAARALGLRPRDLAAARPPFYYVLYALKGTTQIFSA